MALKAIVDSLDEIPEGIRGEYEEVDGKFRLSVDGADALVDTSGIKTALEKERTKAKLVDAIRKEFPNASDDDIRELVKKAKSMKKGDSDPADHEKIVEKLKAQLDEEYAPLRTENESLKGELRTVLLDDQLRKEIADAGVFAEDVEDVLDLTRKHFDLNDKRKIVVLDEDGDPSSVTPKKFYTEVFKKKKPKFYKAPDASGGDSTGRRPNPKADSDADLSKMTATQRLAEHRKRQGSKKT